MDNSNLLNKLKSFEYVAKQNKKKNINVDASFATLTDDEISLVLAYRSKKLRLENNIKQSEFSKSAKLSSATTYSNFEQTGRVSLINFIKIMRNFGRLKELECLLKTDISSIIEDSKRSTLKKRVR